MIEICFNELTITPLCTTDEEVEERVNAYALLLKKMKVFLGGNIKVRYENGTEDIKLQEKQSLNSFCYSHLKDKIWRDKCSLILSMARKPYINEGEEEKHGVYAYNDVRCKTEEKELECLGLYCAFLYHSFAVGFSSNEFWKNNYKLSLILKPKGQEGENIKRIEENVYNISEEAFLLKEDFVDWIVEHHSIPLEVTDVKPEDKKPNFRKDHGVDKLKLFFCRLRNCGYIVSCINSLPFNPKEKKLIRKVYPNGNIEIVLTNTAQGLGLVVETTAQNIYQAKAIAKYIQENYNV